MLRPLPSNPEILLNRLLALDKKLGQLQYNLFSHRNEGEQKVPAYLRVYGPGECPEDPLVWAKFLEQSTLELRSMFTHRELPYPLRKNYVAMVSHVRAEPGDSDGEATKMVFKDIRHFNHLVSEILGVIDYQVEGIRDIPKETLCPNWYVDLTTFATEQMDFLMPRKAGFSKSKTTSSLERRIENLSGNRDFLQYISNGINGSWRDGDSAIPDYIRQRNSTVTPVATAADKVCMLLDYVGAAFPNRKFHPTLENAKLAMQSLKSMPWLSSQDQEVTFQEGASHAHHLVSGMLCEYSRAVEICWSYKSNRISKAEFEKGMADLRKRLGALMPRQAA